MKNVSGQTLWAILICAGLPAFVVESCVAGRLPRSFGNRNVTLTLKIRDAYLWLAEACVDGIQEITLTQILFKIMPEWSMGELALEGLTATAQRVRLYTINYKNYKWQSPAAGYISYLTPMEILTAIRLYYIYTIWQNNPSFLEADFSPAIQTFDDNAVARILAENEPTLLKPTVEQKKLMKFLADAPRSRREIEEHMCIKRGNLLTNYLYPARDAGWITTTDTTTPSSPSQRYTLTEAGKQAIANS